MGDFEVRYDVTDRVGTLTVSHPPVNALTYEQIGRLREELHTIPREDELAVVVQTAGSKAFMGGHDIGDLETSTAKTERDGTDTYMAFLEELYELSIPTVAAIDGPALGTGLVVACFCDLRVVAPSATLGLPEIDVGLAAGYRPVRRQFPDGIARYMALTGKTIDGDHAYRLGFASERSESPKEDANKLAREIAAKSPDAVEAFVGLINRHQPEWPMTDFRRERRRTEELMLGDNAAEAREAFFEGRDPEFDR
ncbi:enoyl-CoA hydratase/isomerase family protein [Natronomonas marina]|jgi:enoyl-CoA hydratase/carnithine racemase|uniref:enoyl-CoA hydratase/isomerase family protein n=1 Tax=Natronomonas marina TaxID=2961939 RepID=UPI0020CA2504|nr:enoyl-CoA hydratase/isomerase family protein [Natronomonas marina]